MSSELRGTNRFRAALLGHPHAAADVGPGRAGATGLVDEVAEEVVGQVAEPVGGQGGLGEVGERVAVRVLGAHGRDEVVEAYGCGFGQRVNRNDCTRIWSPCAPPGGPAQRQLDHRRVRAERFGDQVGAGVREPVGEAARGQEVRRDHHPAPGLPRGRDRAGDIRPPPTNRTRRSPPSVRLLDRRVRRRGGRPGRRPRRPRPDPRSRRRRARPRLRARSARLGQAVGERDREQRIRPEHGRVRGPRERATAIAAGRSTRLW